MIGIIQKTGQDAEGLASCTTDILKSWQFETELNTSIEKRWIRYFTSDTTAVMPKFIKALGFIWIPCHAHLLNLVVTDAVTHEKKSVCCSTPLRPKINTHFIYSQSYP